MKGKHLALRAVLFGVGTTVALFMVCLMHRARTVVSYRFKGISRPVFKTNFVCSERAHVAQMTNQVGDALAP